MNWIILSFIYAAINAIYTSFNEEHRYNGYVLGIWRGFGISLLTAPLLLSVPFEIPLKYFLILVMQGLMIGVYDSHIFFAAAKYGSHAGSGFMATSVLITTLLWWAIDFDELSELMQTPPQLITLGLILCGFSVSYWQMMQVKVNKSAESYLYPAVFALALMSIATRYIALHGGSPYAGVVYYLTVACFVSGCYNAILYLKERKYTPLKEFFAQKLPFKQALWLIAFSTVLITSKTLALRYAPNPGYVVATLLTSPLIAESIKKRSLRFTPAAWSTIIFLFLLLTLYG